MIVNRLIFNTLMHENSGSIRQANLYNSGRYLRMIRTKILSVVLVVLLLASCLAGCVNNNEGNLASNDASGENNVTELNNQNDINSNNQLEKDTSDEEIDPYGPVGNETTVIHIGRAESANITYEEGEDSLNNYIVKYLQDQLNVKYVYDFSVDDSSYNTKVAMGYCFWRYARRNECLIPSTGATCECWSNRGFN